METEVSNRFDNLVLHTKDWSPIQTAGWLEKNYSIKVSHEAIYQIIRNDNSGGSPVIVGQKGAIENANELIHQYIPKEMELNSISDKKLAFIVA